MDKNGHFLPKAEKFLKIFFSKNCSISSLVADRNLFLKKEKNIGKRKGGTLRAIYLIRSFREFKRGLNMDCPKIFAQNPEKWPLRAQNRKFFEDFGRFQG